MAGETRAGRAAPSGMEAQRTEETRGLDAESDVWEALNSGEGGARVGLCGADSGALAEARAALEALEELAGGLDDEGALADFSRRAAALYNHECLAVGRADEPHLDLLMGSGAQAKVFWDAGLGAWFQAYLDLADGRDRTIWLLPGRREVVTAKSRPSDRLGPWMCPADPDSPCGRSVSAWRSRAERYFELWEHSGGLEIVDCSPSLAAGPAEDAYARWRACEDGALRRHSALPIGGLGPIEEGWVVVYGRRGHYRYCDEVAAFELASGSYYRFSECDNRRELDGLVEAGAVDPPTRGVEVEVGTIAEVLIREFAWATISTPYVQADVVMETALGRSLPDGVEVTRAETWSVAGLGLSGSGSSGHTTLGWLWAREAGETLAEGELSWPSSLSKPAEDHAVRLLAIAEGSGVKGCASTELPAWLVAELGEGRLPQSEHGLVNPPSAALLGAMSGQVKRGRCVR